MKFVFKLLGKSSDGQANQSVPGKLFYRDRAGWPVLPNDSDDMTQKVPLRFSRSGLGLTWSED